MVDRCKIEKGREELIGDREIETQAEDEDEYTGPVWGKHAYSWSCSTFYRVCRDFPGCPGALVLIRDSDANLIL